MLDSCLNRTGTYRITVTVRKGYTVDILRLCFPFEELFYTSCSGALRAPCVGMSMGMGEGMCLDFVCGCGVPSLVSCQSHLQKEKHRDFKGRSLEMYLCTYNVGICIAKLPL